MISCTMALVRSCPIAQANFEWEENVSSNGKLCNQVLQLHCPNDVIFELRVRIKLDHAARKIYSFFTCKFPSICVAFCTMKMEKAQKSLFMCKPFQIKPPCGLLEFSSSCVGSVSVSRLEEFFGRIQFSMELQLMPFKMRCDEPTLEKLVKDLCLSSDKSDFKIICDGQEFPCHKFVLSARSTVFEAMFEANDTIENHEGLTYINDISADTMRALLTFMYKDVINAGTIDANLLIAADKYNVKRLFVHCLQHLLTSIDSASVMTIIVAAFLVNNDELFAKAAHFVMNNRGQIEMPDNWAQIKTSYPGIACKILELTVFHSGDDTTVDTDDSGIDERTITSF